MKWVSPQSVDAYIADRPMWAQTLLRRLRKIVTATVPQARESIKYTVPFYEYHGLLCFLSAKPGHVVLALCEGASLPDPFKIMSGSQKQIRHIIISPEDALPEKEIRAMLNEAARFNEMRVQIKALKKERGKRKF